MKNKTKTLDDLFKEYIFYCKIRRLRQNTIDGYKRHFDTFLKLTGIKYPTEFTSVIWGKFMDKLQNRERRVGKGEIRTGIKDSTARTYWNKLNTFCQWLVSQKILEKNPVEGLEPPYPDYNDKKAIDHDEILKIYGAISLHYSVPFLEVRDKAIFSTMLYAGLRKGELLGLRVIDVDLKTDTLNINKATSKSRKERQLPIIPELHDNLEAWFVERNKKGCKSEKLFVSYNRDEGITEHGFKHLIERMKDLSGVNFHAHRLRHTCACELARHKVSTIEIQKALGHTDPRMTERYLRSLGVEDLREGFNRAFQRY